jgi:hypothetical protein
MRKIGLSIALALILASVLALTVYSQRAADSASDVAVRLLQGGVRHQLPIDISMVVSTTAGPQTVTVPLVLNLDLSVGPLDAIDLRVDAAQPIQFASPLQVIKPVTESATITGTDTVTE